MIRPRRRFTELIDRQLALFLADEAETIEEAERALEGWRDSDRASAEEAYGDYQLVVDALADGLLEIREAYAATLTEGADDEYRAEFARAVARRFRGHASIVADLADTD